MEKEAHARVEDEGERPRGGETADRRWQAFHGQLHALASSRVLAAYISRIQLSGDVTEVWELVFSAPSREAHPAKRRFLLRQLAWDVAHGASGASMARALMAMVLWPQLDELYGRFRRRFPHCELLAKFVIDALGMAVCDLRDELQAVQDPAASVLHPETPAGDIEREILAGTLFVIGKLVGEFELRRARLPSREVTPTVRQPVTFDYEAPDDGDTDPDGPAAMAVPTPGATVSLRGPSGRRDQPPVGLEPQRASSPEEFQHLPGLFRPSELGRVLDFEHEFRFSDAGYDRDGGKLVTVHFRRASEVEELEDSQILEEARA